MPKIFLIDGNAYIHRAYHALPPLSTSRGEMVNAVYGFMRLLLKILKSERPEYIAVCFDHPSPTFRHRQYSSYKAHRKEIDDELKNQMPLSHEAVRALNLPLIQKEGYEADDIIATLAREAERDNAEVVVISGDKDVLQLVNGRIKVWNEQKNILFDQSRVQEKYGVSPVQLVDMFALTGDASDNVPGVRGVGEKTAVKLIQEYGSLENLLAKVDSLKGKLKELVASGKEDAAQSKSLVTLRDDVRLETHWTDCVLRPPEKEKVVEFLCRVEFTSLLKEILPPETAEEGCGIPHNKEFSTAVITSREDLDRLVAQLAEQRKLSVDLETTGLNPFTAEIVGISLAFEETEAFYLPVGHDYPGAPRQLSRKEVLAKLKPVLEDPLIEKCGQNVKYDLEVLRKSGIDLAGIRFDSMIASYCLNPSRTSHGLKSIVLDYLGFRMTEIEELIGKKGKQVTMDKVEVERVARYAGADAVMVLRLASKLGPQLREKELDRLFSEVEMPLVAILSGMERHGIKVNVPHLKKIAGEFEASLSLLEDEIYALAGHPFNPNSPKQLSVVLFEELRLPVIKRTKTGYCTDEEVLRLLSAQHELPAKLIKYRELQKLKSTYIDSLLALNDPVTHRIHTSFNQAVTATGRLSSSDPNLQNIPVRSEYGKKIREAFIPEQGYTFLSADYSQIDLRVLAHISGDDRLTEAFKGDEDIHAATAREIFSVPLEEVTPELRRIAKTINFGIVYGMSPYGLAQQLGIPNEKAKEYIDNYFKRYSGVKRWLEQIVKDARFKGYVTTLLGRIRYLPEITSSNAQMRSFAERVAMNTPIQGTSADIIKVAMARLDRLFKEKNYGTRMLVQVHDELLFEVPGDEGDSVFPLIKHEMEKALTLDVPVIVDLKTGANWAEMTKVEIII